LIQPQFLIEDHFHKAYVGQSKSFSCIWTALVRNFDGLLHLGKMSSADSY